MIVFEPILHGRRHGSVVRTGTREETGLCGSNPFQRRADWGITAGRESARKSCHRVSHTGDANRNGESGEGSLMSSPVIDWLKSTSSSGSVIVTSEPPVLWENLLRTSSQVPKLRHRCHRCSEKSGCRSSRFVSIGTVPHPRETVDQAIEATMTTASNGTPRGKTYAFDDISTGHHREHSVMRRARSIRAHRKQQDARQAQPRTDEQTQVDNYNRDTWATSAAETHA